MQESHSFDDLVSTLSNALGYRKLYFSGHPRVQSLVDDFLKKLREHVGQSRKECFFLGVVDGHLVQDGKYLVGPTILGGRIVDFVAQLDSGGILFRKEVESRHLHAFLDFHAELRDRSVTLQEARAMLKAAGVDKIELSPPYEDSGWFGQFLFEGKEDWGCQNDAENLKDLVPVYQSLFKTVEVAHGRAGKNNEVDIDGVRTVSEKLIKAARGKFTDMLSLVRYPDYDTFTVGHSVRVALLAVMVGHKLGLSNRFLVELGVAGLLHDVGKSKVPDEILFKPGKLTPEEREIISQHPCMGAQILLEHGNASAMAIGAAWGHHLRADGRGYPPQEKWAVTSRVTSLLQVCDVFEALTAVRPYKNALPPRRAYEIMLEEGGAFDAGAFSSLVSTMGLYPPGSRVELSNGERGFVIAAGTDIAMPKVHLTHDASGAGIPKDEQRVLDLSAENPENLQVAVLFVDAQAKKPLELRPEERDEPEDAPELPCLDSRHN